MSAPRFQPGDLVMHGGREGVLLGERYPDWTHQDPGQRFWALKMNDSGVVHLVDERELVAAKAGKKPFRPGDRVRCGSSEGTLIESRYPDVLMDSRGRCFWRLQLDSGATIVTDERSLATADQPQ